MERRGSAIFYSDDEGDERRPQKHPEGGDEGRPKEDAGEWASVSPEEEKEGDSR